MHHRGFGFVVPDDKKLFAEDVFIPKRKTCFAVDGDKVEAEVFMEKTSGKGYEGRVKKILVRGRRHLAGTLIEEIGKNRWDAYAPLLGNERELIVKCDPSEQVRVGERVLIEVSDWGTHYKPAKGKISAIIGHIDDPACDIQAAVEEFELKDAFSQEVEEELTKLPSKIGAKDCKGREDFTALECFTIDPDESKDFDDALSLSEERGGYLLGVHIADVSHYIKPKSALDKEARQRCNSVYFPGAVLPMLPPKLSNNLCSLKPSVKRLAVSVMIRLDAKGKVKSHKIVRSVIKSQKRFTYGEAKEILDGKKKSKHAPTLLLMEKVCYLLKAERAKRGAIEFAMPDLRLVVDTKGYVKRMQLVEYDISHQLVEEFMLMANEVVATRLCNEGKPLTYRVHEEPKQENLQDFAQYAAAFGFKLSTTPTNEEIQNLFDEIRESPFGKCLTTSFIRSMKLANYSTQNIGHYGLQLEHYTHFTSPIRRYVDLIIHRLLFNEVDPKADWDAIALKCSEQERLSAKAESSVTLLKKLRHLEQLNTKNNGCAFAATIVSIKPFGVIFEIDALFLEGMVSTYDLQSAPDWTYHQRKGKMVSKARKLSFQAGQKIFVNLTDLDLTRRETSWMINTKKK